MKKRGLIAEVPRNFHISAERTGNSAFSALVHLIPGGLPLKFKHYCDINVATAEETLQGPADVTSPCVSE